MEQLELPELDLPIALDSELFKGDFCVSDRSLDRIDVVQHVYKHAHLVFLDVPVLLSV